MSNRKPTKPTTRGNPDLANWHDRVQRRMKNSNVSAEAAAKLEKQAEMRHYRKAKTPGKGN